MAHVARRKPSITPCGEYALTITNMAKKTKSSRRGRNANNGGLGGGRAQPRSRVPRAPSTGLDGAASAYARLLADPCNGPLVTGPFADGKGGIVSRFEIDQLVNTGGTETCAYFAFCPALGQGYTSSTALVNGGSTITPTGNSAWSPGQTFLAANSGQFRALSACVQVYYPGSESSRSGVVSLGNVSMDAAVINTNVNTDRIRVVSQIVERTPNTMAEIKWRPTMADTSWVNPKAPPSANVDIGGYTALVVTAGGLPAGVGLRIRCVFVCEWQPTISSGFVSPMYGTPGSRNTLVHVLEALDAAGHWMYNGALNVAGIASAGVRAARSITTGARAVAAVGYGVAKYAPMLTF